MGFLGFNVFSKKKFILIAAMAFFAIALSQTAFSFTTSGCSTSSKLCSLYCGNGCSALGNSVSSGATKWHKIYIANSGTLEVSMEGPSGTDFDLYVYSSCTGTRLCRSYSSGSSESCTVSVSGGNYYYIGIDAYSGSGTYSLNTHLTCASCSDDCSTEGQTRCNGSSVEETCGDWDSDPCLEWQGRTCLYGCSSGRCNSSCTDDCLVSGQTRCNGSVKEVCGNWDSDSCLEWQGTTCVNGCTNGACNPSCTDDCLVSGQKRCTGSVSEVCGDWDSDSCLEWQGTTCLYGCSNGSCNPSCTNDCLYSGETRCNGLTVKETCGNWDSDSCLEWQGMTCANGCSNGLCCSAHASSACDSNDLYWFNSCGAKEDIKQDCGNSGYGANYCYDNDVYKDYISKGCSNNACFSNAVRKELVLDCGSTTYGANYCSGNNVVRNVNLKGCSNGQCTSSSSVETVKTCANNEYCDSYKKACVPCSISSASWSTTTARQWDTVQLKARVPSCDGREIVFDIYEDDVIIDDFIQTVKASVSVGYATATWTPGYIEDGYGRPEFYFNAKIGSISKKSSTLNVYPTRTNTDLGSLVDIVKNGGAFTIVTFDSPTGEALNQINQLKTTVETLSGKPARIISHKQISGCWDYANLASNLILIGYYSDNNAINCLKTDNSIEDRALNYAQDQISVVSNPLAYGKYAIIVQGGNNNYDSIVSLKMQLKKGSSKLSGLKDSVVGCFWTGDMSVSAEILCNVIPVVELFPDVRDSYRCVKDHPLTATPVPISSLSDDSLIDDFVCKVTYAAAAYDIVGYVAAVFTVGGGEVAAELGDSAVATFKVTLKSALQGLSRKVVEDAYKTYKLIPDSGKMLWKISRNLPSVTVTNVKALVKMLSNGKDVAVKGMKFLDANPTIYSKVAPADVAIDATTSLFKMEPTLGIKATVNTADNAYIVIKMNAYDKLGIKIKNVQTAVGIPAGSVNEIVFADQIAQSAGALGYLDESTKTIFVNAKKAGSFAGLTKDNYVAQLADNVVPHELVHSFYAPKLVHNTAASLHTEEYLVDLTLKSKLTGTDLSAYLAAEKRGLGVFAPGDSLIDYYEVGNTAAEKALVAEAASKYAEASDYGLTTAKSTIEHEISDYLYVKYPGTANSALRAQKLTEFKAYSTSIKNAATSYFSTGAWNPPADFLP